MIFVGIIAALKAAGSSAATASTLTCDGAGALSHPAKIRPAANASLCNEYPAIDLIPSKT